MKKYCSTCEHCKQGYYNNGTRRHRCQRPNKPSRRVFLSDTCGDYTMKGEGQMSKNLTKDEIFDPSLWDTEIIKQLIKSSVFHDLIYTDCIFDVTMQGEYAMLKTGEAVLISKHKYGAVRVADITRVQKDPQEVSLYAAMMARGFATALDGDVSSMIRDIPQAVPCEADQCTDINKDTIDKAHKLLDTSDTPSTDRCLVIPPDQIENVKSVDGFALNEYYENRKNGLLGTIEGTSVYASNNLNKRWEKDITYTYCSLFYKKAYGLCLTPKARVQAAYDLDYLATSVVGDILYGYKILKPEYAVQIKTVIK